MVEISSRNSKYVEVEGKLVEVRSIADLQTRLKALGCPPDIAHRVAQKRAETRSSKPAPAPVQRTIDGLTDEQFRNRAHNRLCEIDARFANAEARRQDELRIANHQYVARRLEEIAAKEKRNITTVDVSSLRDGLSAALKGKGLVYSSHDDSTCIGIDPWDEEENCAYRYLYGIAADGTVSLVDESRTRVRHTWTAKEVSSIRSYRADAELKRRMQSAAGITCDIEPLGFYRPY